MTHDELLGKIDQARRDGSTTLDIVNNQVTALPTELFQLTQLTTLNIGGNQLTALPTELFQLTHLTTLNIGDNQLTALPAELGQLTHLTTLDINSNLLTPLPAELFQLTQLTTLNIGGNQLTALPADLGQLTHLTTLKVGGNQLTSLPVELFQLTQLTSLYIGGNQLTSLPAELFQLTQLTQLNIGNNQLTALPAELAHLTQLMSLSIGGNQLTSLPAELFQLTHLMMLDIDRNQLTTLPAELGQLTHLTALYLSGNQLTALPAELGQLTQLTRLDVNDNQLTTLPAELGQLTHLTELYLSDNQLTVLPTELGQLTHLTALFVGHNQLTDLPAELFQLTHLTALYVNRNQLTALPAELGQLTHLTTLYLGGNPLTTLPAELGQLTQLTKLYVNVNQLTALPAELGQLTQLTTLDVSDNQLTTLPEWVEQLPALETLDLRSNLLPVPPEVLDADKDQLGRPKAQSLLREYTNIMRSGKPLNEARLIVVGEARAGKTSLVRQLVGEPFDPHEDPTHGILIRTLEVPSDLGTITVNTWDFGGQDIYKATHQFFLSQRAVYVLVLNASQNEAQNRVEYWLNLIASYGKGARVIVAINQSGKYTLNLNERRYQLNHDHIAGNFIRTDAEKGIGIPNLRQAIQDEVHSLRYVHTRLYDRHLVVKQRLQNKNKNFISQDLFANYCEDAGIKGEASQMWLLRLLNDLGSAISFDDPSIADKFVLNPIWVTRGVYAALENTRGTRVRLSDIRAVLDIKDYPGNTPSYILNLMRKFELCYPLDEGVDPLYLLLDKLPDNTPVEVEGWERNSDVLRLEYQYPVLPTSIITRLIARLYMFVRGEPWRSGAFLRSTDGRNEALIYSDSITQHTFIAVRGYEATRRDFFAAIRAQFEHVHATVNLTPEAFVPLPAHVLTEAEHGKAIKPIHYDDLLAAEEAGERDWFVPELRRRINVRTLLDGIRIQITPQTLYAVLNERFSKDELRELCLKLDLDFENIYAGDSGKGRNAEELITYLQRRENLEPLVRYIRRERPGAL